MLSSNDNDLFLIIQSFFYFITHLEYCFTYIVGSSNGDDMLVNSSLHRTFTYRNIPSHLIHCKFVFINIASNISSPEIVSLHNIDDMYIDGMLLTLAQIILDLVICWYHHNSGGIYKQYASSIEQASDYWTWQHNGTIKFWSFCFS